MWDILILSLKITSLLYIAGAGITALLIPLALKKYSFWITPWFGFIFITILSAYLSMVGFDMKIASPYVLLTSILIFLYAVLKGKIETSYKKPFFLVLIFTVFIFLFNIFPLLKVGYPTVLSLGNLDPISYTSTSDYLQTHSVFGGNFNNIYKPLLGAPADLLTFAFRWGNAIDLSFFSSILGATSYKVFTIFITLLFALSYPLAYILTSELFKKRNILLAILTFITYGMNGTLFYMLYHVFIAQFSFTGIFLLFLVLFWKYREFSVKEKFLLINKFEIVIALLISSLTLIYPEGVIFVLAPLGLYFLITFFKNRKKSSVYQGLRIFIFSFLFNPFTFITTAKWYIHLFKLTTAKIPIGWEMIRFSYPYEWLGFYSLYYSRDLPLLVDLLLSGIVLWIIFVGFINIKRKSIFGSYLLFFVLIYFFYSFINNHFFAYHRAVTYSIFLYTIFFSIGISVVVSKVKNKVITTGLIVVLLLLSLRTGYRTWVQFYNHHLTVDQSLISLQSLNNNKSFSQIIATSDIFYPEGDIWTRLWSFYFLPDKKILSRQNYKSVIKDIKIIPPVLYKKELYRNDPKISYTKILWENEYYILGEVDSLPVYEDLNIVK